MSETDKKPAGNKGLQRSLKLVFVYTVATGSIFNFGGAFEPRYIFGA